jgi:hypothetical protein
MEPPTTTGVRTLTADERKAILARTILSQMRPGMVIESQSDFQAVLALHQPPDTALHILLGFLTFGIFWIVKLIAGSTQQPFRRLLYVTEDGTIQYRDFT